MLATLTAHDVGHRVPTGWIDRHLVLVVEADRTTQALVKHALETIETCPVVMMVLNKAPRPEVGSYYGHHYYANTAAS